MSAQMNTNVQRLYIVVRHRRHQPQRWQNIWFDDKRLWAIETTTEIGQLCEREKEKDEPVFIHRCACGTRAIVCCSALVTSVEYRGAKCLVTFGESTVLNIPPTVTAPRRNHYFL